ncbi:MAG: hypothetical protein HFH87_13055 [Lachnospiraceae bacterium]|nr:hypothetical protein [Lachnospiraceae bacterium]
MMGRVPEAEKVGWKNKISMEMEKCLEEFDTVILVDGHGMKFEALEELYGAEALKKTRSRILILAETKDQRKGGIIRRHASTCEMQELLRLYRMYEFSDRVALFSQEDNFGGLHNYVKTGVFTLEEAVSAFLQLS